MNTFLVPEATLSARRPAGRPRPLLRLAQTLNCALWLFVTLMLAAGTARAGLTLELHLYRNNDGGNYSFYTPLYTNSLAPNAPLGNYIIQSPHEPTNGSVRAFSLTASGISDIDGDSEHGYGDFDSMIYQVTNGNWTVLFTNATTTNIYHFTVSAPTITSNMLPATVSGFPMAGSSILTNETYFTWQSPFSGAAAGNAVVYNNGYYQSTLLSGSQNSWSVDYSFPPGSNYSFQLQYISTNTLFTISTPTNVASSQPFGGWDSYNVLESGMYLNFAVVTDHGVPSHGHTLVANYTFEDNNVFAHDFTESGNNMSYAWFLDGAPPTIVTNDSAAGMYAGGLGGSGWFRPGDGLKPLFAGSFTVSLWVKTTNTFNGDLADLYSAAGIVSDLGDDFSKSCAPMLASGSKLGFYTGGDSPNLLRSHGNINLGQYVHLVTTRDQQTGEKVIYVNGVRDSSIFSSTNFLDSSTNGNLTLGINNGQVFSGKVDEVQFYSGVLSSNDVVFLFNHPGTNVADSVQVDFPVARYDFEDTNNPGLDSSFHHFDANCHGVGSTNDVASTNSAVGTYAREFFGESYYCFGAGEYPGLSNALSGDFTLTAWVNTTNSINSDYDYAFQGMPVLFAYDEYTNGTIPLSITGSKAAFGVYNTNGLETTIHSLTTVNDGRYHFLAVTRNGSNGLMSLYVDGVLEASALGNRAPISTDNTMYIGGGYYNYTGLLDDVRIYGGVLGADDIAKLAGHGASAIAQVFGTSNILWSTSGDSAWFVETTNTYNGAVAALQSGSVSDNQTSAISAVITGPGTLNFAWQNPTYNNLDLELDIDGAYLDDIRGYTDWTQANPVHIPPGRHVLSWTVYANGDTDTNEAAFLGQVSFAPTYLVAQFDFENTNAFYPLDISQNGNDMNYGFSFNGGATAPTNDAAAGTNAFGFYRNPNYYFSGGQVGWSPTPAGLLSTLAGSFTVSLWLKTTNHDGTAGENAALGAPVVVADVPGDARDLTPVALNGGAVTFTTGGTPGDDTLTSAKVVSDNIWHHVVVTRDQPTGLKRIFIDGVEDSASPGYGTAALLDSPNSLSIGARIDGSLPYPPYGTQIYGAYQGEIDDLQIYSKALSPSDVAFLHAHPGQTAVNVGEAIPASEQLTIYIQRIADYQAGSIYVVQPSLLFSTPSPITYHQVSSPNHRSYYRTDVGSSLSDVFTTLNEAINECTNGLWTLVLNAGDPSERTLHFAMSISGLDTNLMRPVFIYSPTNTSVNVSRSPAFQWSGPVSFESIDVVLSTPPFQNSSAHLPSIATNWSTPPLLNYGTNQFFVNYVSNNFPLATFTPPTDTNTLSTLSNWVTEVNLISAAPSTFIVGAPGPLPVHLISPQHTATSLQLSFVTLAGRPEILQGTTNLVTGSWVNLTNFVGDGTAAQFTIPTTNRFRFFRVITQ